MHELTLSIKFVKRLWLGMGAECCCCCLSGGPAVGVALGLTMRFYVSKESGVLFWM